ncbi:hypothetical protein FIV00_03080 [Labrenzia sp. THAF82]|nr:hypothetical protein FIV00_03080 [Labrenzia sp. THAF82]
MIRFNGSQFPKVVVVFAVFFYVRYGVSYRDLEEIMEERGVDLDHTTLNRWVIRYSPAIAAKVKARKRPVCSSWKMDETYGAPRPGWPGGHMTGMHCEKRNGRLPCPLQQGA